RLRRRGGGAGRRRAAARSGRRRQRVLHDLAHPVVVGGRRGDQGLVEDDAADLGVLDREPQVDEVVEHRAGDVGADDVLRGGGELLVLLEQGDRVGRVDDRPDGGTLAGHPVVVGEPEPATRVGERGGAVHVLVRSGGD